MLIFCLCFCSRVNKEGKWKVSKQSSSNGTRTHRVSWVRVRTWEWIVVWWLVSIREWKIIWVIEGEKDRVHCIWCWQNLWKGWRHMFSRDLWEWPPENLPTRTCHESYSSLNRKVGIRGSHSNYSLLGPTVNNMIRDQEAAASANAHLPPPRWFLETRMLLQRIKPNQTTHTLYNGAGHPQQVRQQQAIPCVISAFILIGRIKGVFRT